MLSVPPYALTPHVPPATAACVTTHIPRAVSFLNTQSGVALLSRYRRRPLARPAFFPHVHVDTSVEGVLFIYLSFPPSLTLVDVSLAIGVDDVTRALQCVFVCVWAWRKMSTCGARGGEDEEEGSQS